MVQIDYSKGFINEGNDERMLACMAKGLKGEPLTVAFLGGSITQGSLSSTPELCYAYLTYEWWKEQFPKSEITYVNAGIGGTTSHLGTGRVDEEVLSHKPDFVIVEFSVNDADTDVHFEETYEGLVRRILKNEKHPARIVRRDITPDDLHPNDTGHKIVSGLITSYLAKEKKKAEELMKEGYAFPVKETVLPAPLTANGYETAHRYRNDELKPVICEGFVKDETPQSCVADCFKKGFSAARINDRIVFEVEASSIAVQYRKTVRRPAPVATLILDGDKEHTIELNANFEEDWGDCLYLQTVLEHGESGRHTVEITISETHEDDREVFYLVSLITA